MDVLVEARSCGFDNFLLDREGRTLSRLNANGERTKVPLGSRAFEILCLLIDRRGEFVSRREIMAAVWPNATVEENNLTVQMAALRRALDVGVTGRSLIQTVPGRGYRLICPVNGVTQPDCPAELMSPVPQVASAPGSIPTPARRGRPHWLAGALAGAALLIGLAGWLGARMLSPQVPPRLSLVVLAFENLGGGDDHLADAISDDLTSELAQHTYASVVARETAHTFKGKHNDVRTIGQLLNVRYVIEGGVRQSGNTVRVSARLISAETGMDLWSAQFDEQTPGPLAEQDGIVQRLRSALSIRLYAIESARSLRERPSNPDAFDLIIEANAMQNLPQTTPRDQGIAALYERALRLDPSSVPAMVGVAYWLVDLRSGGAGGTFDDMQRAERLLARARSAEPASPMVLNTTLYWLRNMERCPEVIEAAENIVQVNPKSIGRWTGIYTELGICSRRAGHAEREMALQQQQLQSNGFNPWRYTWYRHLGYAALMLGRDQEAIGYFQHSLAGNPTVHVGTESINRGLAAAYARTGQMQEAKRYLSEADRIFPYDTVRGHGLDGSTSEIYAQQVRNFQAALRLAGERDHAEEDADFGVPSDSVLHSVLAGQTPTTAPGVKTIRTDDLVRFLQEARPVIIDTAVNAWGRSIPGAVGLKFAWLGGEFDDSAQPRLKKKMQELTANDPDRPIVVVGWNAERFDGRNLALRLAALGFGNVYWYRGGREAWEVHGLPETNLELEEW